MPIPCTIRKGPGGACWAQQSRWNILPHGWCNASPLKAPLFLCCSSCIWFYFESFSLPLLRLHKGANNGSKSLQCNKILIPAAGASGGSLYDSEMETFGWGSCCRLVMRCGTRGRNLVTSILIYLTAHAVVTETLMAQSLRSAGGCILGCSTHGLAGSICALARAYRATLLNYHSQMDGQGTSRARKNFKIFRANHITI